MFCRLLFIAKSRVSGCGWWLGRFKRSKWLLPINCHVPLMSSPWVALRDASICSFALLTCQRVNVSTCQRVNVSTCQRVNVSTCQRVNVSTCQRVNVSTCVIRVNDDCGGMVSAPFPKIQSVSWMRVSQRGPVWQLPRDRLSCRSVCFQSSI
jgi:hypothetical protein